MKLHYWRPRRGPGNFGDELNAWLWPQLIGDLLDDDESTLFIGIGTLLNEKLPQAARRIIFGTGYGYGKDDAFALDPSFEVHCVRGPLSAERLGLSSDAAVTDPALLAGRLRQARPTRGDLPVAYMPHRSEAGTAWRSVCAERGFTYIDPGSPVVEVIDSIGSSELLITEALHGAVVAAAHDVPWIGVRSGRHIYVLKWQDWCASMKADYQPHGIFRAWDSPDEDGSDLSAVDWERRRQYMGKRIEWIRDNARPVEHSREIVESHISELERRLERLRAGAIPPFRPGPLVR